jgi:hypothetical protein
MAVLNAADRKAMPKSEFAGPGRSFPVNDSTHARMAISGATRSEHAGNISPAEADRIKAEARGKLDKWENKKSGGDPKGVPAMDHKAAVAKMHPDHVHRLVTEAAAGMHGAHAMNHAHHAMMMPQDGAETGNSGDENIQSPAETAAPQRSPFSDNDADDMASAPQASTGTMFSGGR